MKIVNKLNRFLNLIYNLSHFLFRFTILTLMFYKIFFEGSTANVGLGIVLYIGGLVWLVYPWRNELERGVEFTWKKP